MFALQFALKMGLNVIATSSNDEKLDRLKSIGASDVINYKTDPEWSRNVRSLTEKVGVDAVIEVGGAGTLSQSIRSVKPGGTIALIGVLAGGKSPVDVIPVLMQQIRIQGVLVGHRKSFETMNQFLEKHSIKPLISHRFSFEDSPAAFIHQLEGKHFGKVVIDI